MALKTRLQWKAFTSFNTLISFIIMSISGIFLYFAPPGRVAHWVEWKFLLHTKAQWQAIHTIFSYLFFIIGIVHLYLNWKPFVSYIKVKIGKGIRMKWELIGSILISLVIYILTLIDIPPFSTIMVFGDALKNSWSTQANEPPIPHAELLTLTELAETMQVSVNRILQQLQQEGLVVTDTSISIKDLAEQYQLSPKALYEKIKVNRSSKQMLTGSGYGRKTVLEVCNQLNLPIELVIQRLQRHDIQASKDDLVRDLAIRHNLAPIELVEYMKSNSPNRVEP